jgi:hypothetical protein
MPIPSRRTNAVVSLILGLAAGAALPFVQVYLECGSAPASEACAWGKSLLPLTVSISAVLVGAFVAMGLFAILESRRAARPDEDQVEPE